MANNQHDREILNDSFNLERDGLVYEHLKALAEFSINPIEKDPRIGAYRTAMFRMLAESDEPATGALETIYRSNQTILTNPEIPPIYASNLYLRYLQSYLMDEENVPAGLRYPQDFTNEAAWRIGMNHVAEIDELGAELELCANRPIQSNVFDRYKAVKLAVNMHGERFGYAPRVLDIGCSQNLGLKVVESHSTNRGGSFFNPTRIEQNPSAVASSERLGAKISELIERPSTIGKSHGVDLFWPGDAVLAKWIKACSFYPSELLQEELVALYDALAAYESPNIGFVWTDFANPVQSPNSRVNTRLPDAGSVDLAVLSTILYQVSRADQVKMLDRAYELLADNGLLIVQDFVVVHEDEPKQLDFSPWHHRDTKETMDDPYPYKAFIWDKAESEKGFQSLISWSSGRCQEGKPGDYLLEKSDVLI